MKHQLEQLIIQKEKKLNNFSKTRNKLLALVFKESIERKSIREIHKDIRKVTKIEGIQLSKLEKYCMNVAVQVKKKVDADANILDLGLIVFDLFRKQDVYRETKKIGYEEAKIEEADGKIDIINDELKRNRRIGNPRIFYLASSHDDCAEDHKSSQGKLYIDEKWRNVVTDEVAIKVVEDLIKKYEIKTFQWVIGKPVYFITRPNCRHYFKALRLQDVFNVPLKELIENYDMHSKIGNRKYTQTIAHSKKKDWYKAENVENIIKQYEDRLAYHKALYDVNKLDILKKAIDKDKLLIKKWKTYLKRLKK